MTEYRLKLLTILANLLTSNLLDFNKKETSFFVLRLIGYLEKIDGNIP